MAGVASFVWKKSSKFAMEGANVASPSFVPLPTLVMDSTINFLCLSRSIWFCEVLYILFLMNSFSHTTLRYIMSLW